MENVILIICLLILSILLGVLVGIIILYKDALFNNDQTLPAMKSLKKEYGIYTGNLPYGSETSYGRIWHVELWNQNERRLYWKNFSGQIVLGRLLAGSELFWQMQVGNDSSISREQCVIYDQDGMLIIENLSQVNPTLVNNMPISNPLIVRPGAIITMGRVSAYISTIQRVA